MNEEHEAVPVAAATGATPTDDGRHVLARFEMVGEGEIILAIPAKSIPGLILSLSAAANGALRKEHGERSPKLAVECSWWELGLDPDRRCVLSLQTPGGGELSYFLADAMLQPMRDALNVLLGDAPTDPTPGRLQ